MNLNELGVSTFGVGQTHILLLDFVINLVLAGILAYILGRFYIKWGTSLSNRRRFAGNFVLIVMTTMFIIVVVKSSLALSLGLVGALSIIRFRTAIKDPEELAYLFFSISIGLGLGADQRTTTITAFVIICTVIWVRAMKKREYAGEQLYLSLTGDKISDEDLELVISNLNKICEIVDLKRFDQGESEFFVSFSIEIKDTKDIQSIKKQLGDIDSRLSISFVDLKNSI